MKPTSTLLKPFPVIASLALLLSSNDMIASVKPYKNYTIVNAGEEEEKGVKKTKKEAKKTNAKFSLNNKVVKIYPDIVKREMHVVIKDSKSAELDFFVFSTDGTLVLHYKMGPKEHKKLSGLDKGKYVYRVFNGDEETATGQFEIR